MFLYISRTFLNSQRNFPIGSRISSDFEEISLAVKECSWNVQEHFHGSLVLGDLKNKSLTVYIHAFARLFVESGTFIHNSLGYTYCSLDKISKYIIEMICQNLWFF